MIRKLYEEKYQELREVLDFAINNSCSNFYKKNFDGLLGFLESNDPESFIKGFNELPLLEKDHLFETPLVDRTFVPKERIVCYRSTSGTTKNKRTLLLPSSDVSKVSSDVFFGAEKIKKFGVESLLVLAPINHGFSYIMIYSENRTIPVNFVDLGRLEGIGKLIKETGINAIAALPTVLEASLEYIQDANATGHIKWIILAGENCSEEKRKLIQGFFPNAFIDFSYGMVEAQGVSASRCLFLKDKEPNFFHILPNKLIEIVKEDGSLAVEGEEGEIVITNLEKNAFPAIRYKTGDMGIIKASNCKCGNHFELELLGRAGFDFVKIKGVTIHKKAIEYALAQVPNVFTQVFLLEIFEKNIKGKLMVELLLKVVPQKGVPLGGSRDQLAKIISDNLQLSQNKTLTDMASIGIFLPLNLQIVEKINSDTLKRVSIVSNVGRR